MKQTALISTVALMSVLMLSSCATVETATEPAACKVVPLQTTRINHDASKNTPLDNTKARADLAGSSYRLAQLRTGMGMNGAIEEALRDCEK
jgi:hypothetical protein